MGGWSPDANVRSLTIIAFFNSYAKVVYSEIFKNAFSLKSANVKFSLKSANVKFSLKSANVKFSLKSANVKFSLKSANVKFSLKSANVKFSLKSANVKFSLKSANVKLNHTIKPHSIHSLLLGPYAAVLLNSLVQYICSSPTEFPGTVHMQQSY